MHLEKVEARFLPKLEEGCSPKNCLFVWKCRKRLRMVGAGKLAKLSLTTIPCTKRDFGVWITFTMNSNSHKWILIFFWPEIINLNSNLPMCTLMRTLKVHIREFINPIFQLIYKKGKKKLSPHNIKNETSREPASQNTWLIK